MSSSAQKGVAPIIQGTVSHGTLRMEDLVPAYLGAFQRLASPEAQEVFHDQWDADAVLAAGAAEGAGEAAVEELAEMLDVLDRMINQELPEGWYFGPLEGDGSDIGVWQEPWEAEVDTASDSDVRSAWITYLDTPPIPAQDAEDWSECKGDYTIAGRTFGFSIDRFGSVVFDDLENDPGADGWSILGHEHDLRISEDRLALLGTRIRTAVRSIEADAWNAALGAWAEAWEKSVPSRLDD